MDAWLNPTTGDYDLANKALTADPANGLANAVYIRLMTPLGSWWQDATLGSRLHELVRQKDLSRVGLLANQYTEDALKPILTDGRATKIEVTVDQPHNGRLLLSIAVTAASGAKFTFKHYIKVH